MSHEKNNHLLDELDPHLTRLEVVGNRSIFVENHCGVQVYSDTQMQVACRRFVLCVSGTALRIVGLALKSMTIEGEISQIQFAETP